MPNTIKLLIPIGLGIAAAIINFVVLSSATQPVKFVVAKKDISAGESFKDKVTVVDVPIDMAKSLKDVAILHDDRGLLSGQTAKRNIAEGDIILYRDTAIKGNPTPDFRTSTERARAIELDGLEIYGAAIGDSIWFDIPGYQKAEGTDMGEEKYTGPTQKIGPYRILGIGTQMNTNDSARTSSRSTTVTIAYEPDLKLDKNNMVKTLLEYLEVKKKDTSGALEFLAVEYKPSDN
jgi:hypothetical protein